MSSTTSVNAAASQAAAQRAAERARQQAEAARRAAREAQEAAQEKATQAAQQNGNQAANHALKLEQKANTAAVGAYQKKPFAAAESVRDVYDAASLSTSQQKKLFGAAVQSVSPAQAARTDAKKIAEAVAESPEAGAQALREQMEQDGASPAYRRALAKAAAGSVRAIGAAMNEDTSEEATESIVSDLSKASELSGKTGAQTIARSFGSDANWEELPNTFQEALETAIQGGAGTRFGIELSRVAEAADAQMKTGGGVGTNGLYAQVDAADTLSVAVTRGVEELREDYEDVKEEADQLDAKLGKLVAGYGPGLTDQQRQDAIDAFRARHEDVYGELERLGGAMAQSLAGLSDVEQTGSSYEGLTDEANAVLEHVPDLRRTEAGRQVISDALEAEANGEDTFIDSMASVAEGTGAPKAFLDGVNHAFTDAAAEKVLQLAGAGDVAGAQRVIDEVSSLSTFSEEDRAALRQTSDSLNQLFSDDPEVRAGALDSLEASLEGSETKDPLFEDQNGAAANMVRTLGVVAGVANAAKGFQDFDELALEQQVKVISDSLGTTAEAGLLAMDIFGRESGALANALGKVAAPVAVVGTVVDGIGAAKSFADGHIATGSAQTAQTIGGALLTAAALSNAVPVAGQIAGVVLFAGGAIAQAIIGDEALEDDEEDARAFLEAAGFSPELAEAYTPLEGDDRYNPGEFFQAVAKDQGISVEKLFDWMRERTVEEAQAFAIAGQRDYASQTEESLIDYLEEYGLVPGRIPDPTAVQKIVEEGELFGPDGAWETGPILHSGEVTTPDNVA